MAHADVMEVGDEGYHWVAGGPIERAVAEQSVALAAISHDDAALTRPAQQVGPQQWTAHLHSLAAKYDLSPALLEALVWQESRWRPGATSPAGAHGLAQLMPGTARQLGVDPHDPAANLEGGARYLRMQLDAFGGDLEKALAAYNAGPNRVVRAGGVPPIRETQSYIAAIMARLSMPTRR